MNLHIGLCEGKNVLSVDGGKCGHSRKLEQPDTGEIVHPAVHTEIGRVLVNREIQKGEAKKITYKASEMTFKMPV